MTFKDWDECLKFLVVLTKWPPIVLLVALIFRGAIAKKLADLKQITIKDKTEIVFETLEKLKKVAAETSPELFQQFVLNLPHSAITSEKKGVDEAKTGKKTNDAEEEEVDEDDDKSAGAEQAELEKQLKALEDN